MVQVTAKYRGISEEPKMFFHLGKVPGNTGRVFFYLGKVLGNAETFFSSLEKCREMLEGCFFTLEKCWETLEGCFSTLEMCRETLEGYFSAWKSVGKHWKGIFPRWKKVLPVSLEAGKTLFYSHFESKWLFLAIPLGLHSETNPLNRHGFWKTGAAANLHSAKL